MAKKHYWHDPLHICAHSLKTGAELLHKRQFHTLDKIDPQLTSSEIGKSIGRSRQTIDSYIADLRAASLLELKPCFGYP
ncbi:MAG: HTH domain-containing protein [Desulfobacula sp.]|nr:HTH domain-containing protein [Bacteroidota bacterium]MBT3805941.1 HTH domain-containing protein [Desulfobacula sp.]MBT5546036.1 HTH domain-containing protein [Desulfobacula sp.]MBT5972572.1 HTH domain-containing protein [Desulfobacula sp.]MBT6751052.1 HTH domain-containing protein [Desulfobacula sp.]